MTLTQMYYFVEVCDCNSFSRAAEKLFVTQPTLSKQIFSLEAELGIQLIERRRGGKLSLTHAGEEYLQSFRRMIREYEEAGFRAHYGQTQKRRSYHIAAAEGWMLHGLIRLCRNRLTADFPDVELQFDFLQPAQLHSQRSAGSVDLCLCSEDSWRPVSGYTREFLTEISGFLYVSAKNPCVDEGDVHILPLRNELLYSLSLQDLPGLDTDGTFQMMGGRGLLIRESSSMYSIKMNILSGSGYSFADAWSEVIRDARFQAKLLPASHNRAILFSRREGDESPLTQAMLDCIRDWSEDPTFD